MTGHLQLLIFLLDGRCFGLHLRQVRRVVRAVDVVPLPNAPDIVLGAIDVRGSIVSVFNVRRRFGFVDREISPDDQFIIAGTSQRTVALAVDSVTDVIVRPKEQLVAASEILDQLELVEGALQLEDGLVLIHDLDRFLSPHEERALEQALTRPPE
jgi:purine-binding chemotaxis protein CheW